MIPITQNTDDLAARYDRTFVKYDDYVWWCRVQVDDDGDVEFFLTDIVNNRKSFSVDPYKGVDSSSIPLGYVNFSNNCKYIVRHPWRRWKQTVCEQTLSDQIPSNMVFSTEVNDMLQGQYPSLEEAAFQIANGNRMEMAISRYIKVRINRKGGRRLNVYFKDDLVGEIVDYQSSLVMELNSEKISWAMSPFLNEVAWRVKDDN